MAAIPVLDVQGLKTYFFTRSGVVKAVDGVSFTLMPGETLGIVGESGSGKSMTALSLMQLVPQPAGRLVEGRILFPGEDLVQKTQEIFGSPVPEIGKDVLLGESRIHYLYFTPCRSWPGTTSKAILSNPPRSHLKQPTSGSSFSRDMIQ